MPRIPSTDRVSRADRRRFLGRLAETSAALALAAVTPSVASTAKAESSDGGNFSGIDSGEARSEQAFEMWHKAALHQRRLPIVKSVVNGDELVYGNRIGNYSKALPHNPLGEVEPTAYDKMLKAISSGYPADFEKIPIGGKLKLANPQAALTFCLEGADSHSFTIATPPSFSSAQIAGEMVELYWQSLTRDVPFAEYDTNPLTLKAIDELSKLADFQGPKIRGMVTPATLFRGNTPGDTRGPYVSQFLLKPVPYGAILIAQRIRTTLPEVDYMTSYLEWLAVQNGSKVAPNKFDPTPRYINTARDLASFVHEDFTYQAFLNACLILMGMKVPFDMSDPYMMSENQSGFSTFGPAHVLDALAKVANAGLRASWYQKWLVHRRLRPEEYAGAIHRSRKGQMRYPIHKDVLDSRALAETVSRSGTYLLPQAYPEGCPAHPSYPAGHAVIAGACATVLKAFFEESFIIREPVTASANGLSLTPYKEMQLNVGDELNKLAANIAIARNAAGVHWRSDAIEGLKFGEAVALDMLREGAGCLTEDFSGFGLTRFDGTTIVV